MGGNATATWYLNINNELLSTKVTRSSSLTLDLKLPNKNLTTTGKVAPQTTTKDTSSFKLLPKLEQSSSDLLPSSSAIEMQPPVFNAGTTPQPSLKATPQPSLVDDVGIYWHSPEARKLFAPTGQETVLEAIDNQINALKKANDTHLSYLDIIDVPAGETLDEDSLTSYQVWAIQQRCIVLCLALKIAKEKMNGLTWQKCCEEAIDYGSALGLKLTSKARTVMEWYRSFRVRRKLARPPRKKHNLPPFLQLNPDVCSAIQQYGREHLVDLSIEMMVEYIHGIVLPKIVAEEAKMSIEEVRQHQAIQAELTKETL